MVTEKELAKQKIQESIRDLLTIKVTLPLGNPNLKLLHTNQFCYMQLPDEFHLDNMERIGNALKSSNSGFTGYDFDPKYNKLRLYIEGITINHDGTNPKMELELNPFGSNNKYLEDYEGFLQAYIDATNSNNKNNNKNGNDVKSVKSDNSTFKGGEGKDIDNQVKDIIGDETDNLKKAKLIDKWLGDNRRYNAYANSRCNKDAKRAWQRRKNPGINCADTSNLTAAMFRAAGIDCYIVHASYHYYTVFKYKGKEYASDQTSIGHRPFNKIWVNHKKGSHPFKGKSSYYAVCGDKSCS